MKGSDQCSRISKSLADFKDVVVWRLMERVDIVLSSSSKYSARLFVASRISRCHKKAIAECVIELGVDHNSHEYESAMKAKRGITYYDRRVGHSTLGMIKEKLIK